jgi:hypothetical protein
VPSWVIVLTALLDHVFARYLSIVAGLDRDHAEHSVRGQLASVCLRSPYKPRTSCPTIEALLYPSTESHAASATQSVASSADVATLPAVGGDKLAALRLKSLNEHVSALLVALSSRYPLVRETARRWLVAVLLRFPAVWHNRANVTLLFDLMQTVYTATVEAPDHHASASGGGASRSPLALSPLMAPHIRFDLPDDRLARMRILASLATISLVWVRLLQRPAFGVQLHQLYLAPFNRAFLFDHLPHVVDLPTVSTWQTALSMVGSQDTEAMLNTTLIGVLQDTVGHMQRLTQVSLAHIGVTFAAQLGSRQPFALEKLSSLLVWDRGIDALGSPINEANSELSALLHFAMQLLPQSVDSQTSSGAPGLLAMSSTALPSLFRSEGARLLTALSTYERYLGEVYGRCDMYYFQQDAVLQQRHQAASRNLSVELRGYFSSGSQPTESLAASTTVSTEPFGVFYLRELQSEIKLITDAFRQLNMAWSVDPSATIWQQQAAHVARMKSLAPLVHRFEAVMYRAAALLLAGNSSTARTPSAAGAADVSMSHRTIGAVDTPALLHLIGKAPAHVFSAPTMAASVTVWQWLLGSFDSTRWELRLLHEVRATLAWTVDHHLGLFSGTAVADTLRATFNPIKEESVVTRQIPTVPVRQAVLQLDAFAAHVHFFQFALDTFAMVAPRSDDAVVALAGMCHRSLANPHTMSVMPGSGAARWQLLALTARVMHHPALLQQSSLNAVLRERWYSAIMAWFSVAARWPANHSRAEVERDYSAMASVCRSLLLESRQCYFVMQREQTRRQQQRLAQALLASSSADYRESQARSKDSNEPVSTAQGTAVVLPSTSSSLLSPWRRLDQELHDLMGPEPEADLMRMDAAAGAHRSATFQRSRTVRMWSVARAHALGEDPIPVAIAPRQSLAAKHLAANLAPPIAPVTFNEVGQITRPVPEAVDRVLDGTDASSPVQWTDGHGGDGTWARWARLRRVACVLVAHEMERMSVWHNPTDEHSRKLHTGTTAWFFRGGAASMTETVRYWSEATAAALLDDAWAISPTIALRLHQRFPMRADWHASLCTRVRASPQSAYSVADLVPFLVTEANAVANIPELTQLCYCVEGSLPFALSLLVMPFAQHRLINQYAIRTLQAHTTEAVVFYLPQLVQALRDDKCGTLVEFLMSACKSSCMLAHRLIWLCLTEAVQDPVGGRPPPKDALTDIVVSLKDRIVSQMNEGERRFYEAEFTFFEKITEISGVLKPLPTKNERKARIAQEVAKIAVLPSLYLPSSPGWQVSSIIGDSGVPLQSAAKVPILIAFICEQLAELPHRPPLHYAPTRRSAAPTLVAAASGSGGPATPVLTAASISPLLQNVLTADRRDLSSIRAHQQTQQLYDIDSKDDAKRVMFHDSSDSDNDEGEDEVSVLPRKASKQLTTRTAATASPKHSGARSPLAEGGTTVGRTLFRQACIFKVNDDIRQDSLSLQVIQVFKNIFESVGLELWLRPYRVVPNRSGIFVLCVCVCVCVCVYLCICVCWINAGGVWKWVQTVGCMRRTSLHLLFFFFFFLFEMTNHGVGGGIKCSQARTKPLVVSLNAYRMPILVMSWARPMMCR